MAKKHKGLLNLIKSNNKKVDEKPQQTRVENKVTPYPVIECYGKVVDLYREPEIKELTVTAEAWFKLMCLIHLVGDYEISGFARVQNGFITDFDILKQEVREAHVQSSDDAVMDFIRRIPADQRTEWILDWHSHVNMGTTPSTTDWGNYEEMLSLRLGKQFPIMIVNKREEATCYQIISKNKHTEISLKRQEIDVNKMTAEGTLQRIYAECKDLVEKNCTKISYSYNTVTTYNSGYYNNQGAWGWGKQDTKAEPRHYWDDIEDDDEVIAAVNKGYVFDEEPVCAECGQPLKSEYEQRMGVCTKCFEEALQ